MKKRAMVTAGATLERIDPVRFISNFSSGKQGFAIARALLEEGYEVILIAGNTNLSVPEGVEFIKIESAGEMLEAALAELPVDIAVFAAAVCDWKPVQKAEQKLKKSDDVEEMTLTLAKNPDILRIIANHERRPKIVVGFAAETENLITNAEKKLVTKNADMIVANSVAGDTFGSDENQVTLITKNEIKSLHKMSKEDVAREIVRQLAKVDIS